VEKFLAFVRSAEGRRAVERAGGAAGLGQAPPKRS